jgi:hypothetical protein
VVDVFFSYGFFYFFLVEFLKKNTFLYSQAYHGLKFIVYFCYSSFIFKKICRKKMVFYKVQLNWRLERREQKREETTRGKKEVQARRQREKVYGSGVVMIYCIK